MWISRYNHNLDKIGISHFSHSKTVARSMDVLKSVTIKNRFLPPLG